MKKLFITLVVLVSFATVSKVSAQSFDENTHEITAFIGGADLFHIPVGYTFGSFIYPTTFEAGVEGEFAVHKYIGVGFVAELGGRGSKSVGYTAFGTPYTYTSFYSEFNMAFGAVGNFHFYQLIADKLSKNSEMLTDKIDVYAGLNLGTGFAIHPSYPDAYGNKSTVGDALFFVGPQFGARYFFTPKIAVNGEFGWGKTWGRVGVTFKLQ